VTANGIEFVFLEVGRGPLALCLHGFPDTAHTWRHLLPALADAGFRAVAPYARGYAPTSCPGDGRYALGALAADAVALHEVLGGDERAVLIGHDWGAEAAYVAAAAATERWRRLVTIAVPPPALDKQIFSDYEQIKRLFYLFFFRSPDADEVVAADDLAFLDRLWEDWSPGYDAAEDLVHVKRSLRDPRNLSAALDYYRAEESEPLREPPPHPTLYLHGYRDGCIGVALASDAKRHLSPASEMVVIEGAGHFAHLERPAAVNALITDWVTT
jgi:pimeloyl-ACP methyl ester carboxylesterase